MKDDIKTTDAAKTRDDMRPGFFGELNLPDFPKEQGRRAHELLRVVATFQPDDDMKKVQASHRCYVQIPEPDYEFPEDNGEFWGQSLAEIAWAIANHDNTYSDAPLQTFNKICGTFIKKAAEIAAQGAVQEVARKAAQEASQKAQQAAQEARKAAQEATQQATRQWITDVVEQATAAPAVKAGAAR